MDVTHILDSLNEPQREAVSAGNEHVLVLAGAGSGKTRVLVHRIVWIVQIMGISPYSILAVTFTNKAAAEMRGRIEQMLNVPTGGMWVGTFHGIAHRILRAHFAEAGLPRNFQIMDSDDQLRLLKRVVRDLQLDEAKWPAKQAQWYINGKKDEGLRPQNLDAQGDFVEQQWIDIYKAYQEVCDQSGLLDFAELLLRAHELWLKNPDVLSHYQRRFRHVLVDEFQDTNTIQYAWLRVLAGQNNKVFIVGDDDQSIYGWRGAKVENIQHVQNDFKDMQLIRLEQNYRSTGNILRAANTLIEKNVGRLGKKLWTAGEDGELIRLYTAYNEQDEARYIVDTIKQYVEQGNERKECAILYRSNAQSRVLEEALLMEKVPYRIYGGMRFFDRAEIKDALGYLRIISSQLDDAAFERVINMPPRGIGEKTIQAIRANALKENIPFWYSMEMIIEAGMLPARASNALKTFHQLITGLVESSQGNSLDELLMLVLEHSGLVEYYQKEKGEKGRARIENLQELVSAAKQFEEDDYPLEDQEEFADLDTLSVFLAYTALESGEGQADPGDDCVQLMTLHSAKGLEFPLVFIAGMEEGLFPSERSVYEPDRLAEERRLCYVGMTRAEKQLVLTAAEHRRMYGRESYPAIS
ncbi:MAG: DNA helicase II, partial [Gammaproteobacteria bacterium]|nr:DNA helicase II [Gammaproteobacteria bacterium]